MSYTCLRNATAVLPDRLVERCSVLFGGANGRILVVARDDTFTLPDDCEVLDLEGRLVGPGFLDLHCHGGAGVWAADDPATAAAAHLAHGTTRMLATTALLSRHADNVAAVRTIADAIIAGRTPNVAGIHMEGPYIHPDHGAYREYAMAPCREEYLEYVAAAQGWLRTMTIAPELKGMAEMVRDLQVATGGGMRFSVGHSQASPAQVRSLVDSGLTLATHLFNANGCSISPTRHAGTREVGVDEVVLLEDAITAELIADRDGHHVRAELLALAHKVKGPDHVVLVTDATAARGDDDHDVRFNDAGELAGSALTMDLAVGNFLRHTGLPLETGWRLATHNPAAAMGWLNEVGILAPGRRADLLTFTYDTERGVDLDTVWLDGKQVAR